MKKVKITGCPACPWHTSYADNFVKPEHGHRPNLIIIGEAPGKSEHEQGKPFCGKSGKLLRAIFERVGAIPVIVNAAQCFNTNKPDNNVIKACRETYVLPIFEQYKNLPIVALGKYASSSVAGGARSETSLLGEALIMHGRLAAFSYHPAFYFYQGYDERILQHIETTIRCALNKKDPASLRQYKPQEDAIVLDVETTSHDYPQYGSKPVLIGIMEVGSAAAIFRPEEIASLRDAWNEKTKLVIGHNLMFDLMHMAALGVTFPNAEFHDTMIYQKNLFPSEEEYSLKWLAHKHLGFPFWEAWFHTQLKEGVPVDKMDEYQLRLYNAGDLYATEQLYLRQDKAYHPFMMEMDYLRYIRDMSINGMCWSKHKLTVLGNQVSAERIKTEANARRKHGLGKDFNFQSWQQVKIVVEKSLKHEVENTREETLKEFEGKHPFIDDLLSIREQAKLEGSIKGTKNAKGLLARLVEHDGVHLIHSKFGVHGAETGRLNSKEPNLQNTDPRVRPCATSRFKNGRLVDPDLSSLEYRLIAHIAREHRLISAFKKGEDIHINMFKRLFNRQPKDDAERKAGGKTPNYVSIYGGGADKFISAIQKRIKGLTNQEIKKIFFSKVRGAYPAVDDWKKEVIDDLHNTGKIRNLFGRVRTFENAVSYDEEREAINWIIQSSGHDILEVFLMEVADRLPKSDEILLVDEIHDAFIFDCSSQTWKQVADVVNEVGSNLNPLIEERFGVRMRVPILAEAKVLKVWK